MTHLLHEKTHPPFFSVFSIGIFAIHDTPTSYIASIKHPRLQAQI